MSVVTKVMFKSFITNVGLSILKVVCGFFGNSMALVADGVHSFSDTLTDVFAIIGNKLSLKPADREHPFGHGKTEYITCIIIGFVILFLGLSIIYKGIFSDINIPSVFTAIVGVVVIFAKLLLSLYVLRMGMKYDNNILIASGRESYTDVISSVIVLLSILFAQLGEHIHIFVYADRVAMIIVGIFVLRVAFDVLSDNFSNLLGKQVMDEDYIAKIKKQVCSHEEVQGIDSLIILMYGSFYQVNLEVSMSDNMVLHDVHNVLDTIENSLRNFDQRIIYVIIQVNPAYNN